MKNKTVFKRVIAVIGRSKLLLFLSLILSVASVILSLYIPVLAGRAIDGIKLHGNVDFEIIKKCLLGILICAIAGGAYFISFVLQCVFDDIYHVLIIIDYKNSVPMHINTLLFVFREEDGERSAYAFSACDIYAPSHFGQNLVYIIQPKSISGDAKLVF